VFVIFGPFFASTKTPLMPIKMAKHAKANVASNALRECLFEEKELIFDIYVSFVVKNLIKSEFAINKNLSSLLFSSRSLLLFPTIIARPKSTKKHKK